MRKTVFRKDRTEKEIRKQIIEEFRALVKRVEYTFQAKEFLQGLLERLETLNWPIRISQQTLQEHPIYYDYETEEFAFVNLVPSFVTAYNKDPEQFLHELTNKIASIYDFTGFISIEHIWRWVHESAESPNLILTRHERALLDHIVRFRSGKRSTDLSYQTYNEYRQAVEGKKPISITSYHSEVSTLRKKISVYMWPRMDYYRLGLTQLIGVLVVKYPKPYKSMSIHHPYIRSVSTVFDYHGEYRYIIFSAYPPKDRVKEFVEVIRSSRFVISSDFFFMASETVNINAFMYAMKNGVWRVNEDALKAWLLATPAKDLPPGDQVVLPHEIEFWHNRATFKNRGPKEIELSRSVLGVLYYSYKAVNSASNALYVNPNAIKNKMNDDLFMKGSLSKEAIYKIWSFLEKNKVFIWHPYIQPFTNRLLNIFIKNPSPDVVKLLKLSFSQLPNVVHTEGYGIDAASDRYMVSNILLPKLTSLPYIYNEFLKAHRSRVDSYSVNEVFLMGNAAIPFLQLWDEREKSWIWDKQCTGEIVNI